MVLYCSAKLGKKGVRGMSKNTTSRTSPESFLSERVFGLGSHYKTTIKDDGKTVTGRGNTAKEAEACASNKRDSSK